MDGPSCRHPEGHLTKIFGRYNDFRSEVNAILFEKGVVREPFGRLTLQELPQARFIRQIWMLGEPQRNESPLLERLSRLERKASGTSRRRNLQSGAITETFSR